MKVLVVGGRSMGRRRLRDLTYLNPGSVFLFEPQPQRCRDVSEAFATRGFTDFAEALALEPDAMVISSPPTLHASYVQTAMNRGLHVFAEVPFIHDKDILLEVAAGADGYPGVLGISHTMCYYPPVRIIHDVGRGGSLGRPLYAEFSLRNYLPDRHPHAAYRAFSAGQKELCGRALATPCDELNPPPRC